MKGLNEPEHSQKSEELTEEVKLTYESQLNHQIQQISKLEELKCSIRNS